MLISKGSLLNLGNIRRRNYAWKKEVLWAPERKAHQALLRFSWGYSYVAFNPGV